MRTAIGETLRLLRPRGRCIVCGAGTGLKHATDCPTWPIIEARAAYAATIEPDLFRPALNGEDDGTKPLSPS
jgi:hypothetical protein